MQHNKWKDNQILMMVSSYLKTKSVYGER
ncbi:uncharacterized protein METZ01_LOCUS207800 [marine metagenome]|uniref:Uncharacterized protein n=1 Tax=marine metagenome TaxID=408172 RepID=A0A382EVY7_9ZZZZ